MPWALLKSSTQERYKLFLDSVNDPNKPVVTVFDPLTKEQLDELEVIREASKAVQLKKIEEMKKAAAQADSDAAKTDTEPQVTEDEAPKENN
ncbi:uncharacterized protein [Battus philenor]|uniref:uncharacterized protein n=1 Tax=Battus philenor TaxID=42288 RepID=UPI0035D03677